MNDLPVWIIGDSADERTFIVHLHFPRFVAEINDSEDGVSAEVADWYDQAPADPAALAWLMREAGEFYLSETEREDL